MSGTIPGSNGYTGKASGTPFLWHMSFTVVVTTLTVLLCKWCSELQQFTLRIISPIFYHFFIMIIILSLLVSFLHFLSASRQACCSAPSAHMLLYSLGAAGCFLTGTQLVLVSGFLCNGHLRGFPPLWKFPFNSETSLLFLPMLTVSWKCMFALRRRLGFTVFL